MTIAREYSALTAEFTFHYGSILIDLPITEASKDVVFTFHYGSILIVVSILCFTDIPSFTFHYGSILILLIMVITTFIIDLHSTMVLF